MRMASKPILHTRLPRHPERLRSSRLQRIEPAPGRTPINATGKAPFAGKRTLQTLMRPSDEGAMWSFGHSVREVERSPQRVVIEETATTGSAWLFGGAALGTLLLWITRPRSSGSTLAEEAVGACAVLYFGLLALLASVRSTYKADRTSNYLLVERRVLRWTMRTSYDAHTIQRIEVRQTNKGSGLYVHFKSRRCKKLSWSLGGIPLEAYAVSLNNTLYAPRQS